MKIKILFIAEAIFLRPLNQNTSETTWNTNGITIEHFTEAIGCLCMKILFRNHRNLYKWLTVFVLSILFLGKSYAQTPSNYPAPIPEPVKLDLINIIVYIILPVIIVVAYILIRRSVRKKRQEEADNREE